MLQKNNKILKENSPYSAVNTREQFLFYEMRTTAKLLIEGLDKESIADRINLGVWGRAPTAVRLQIYPRNMMLYNKT